MKKTRILLSTVILAALAATGFALVGAKKAPAAESCCPDGVCCSADSACCKK